MGDEASGSSAPSTPRPEFRQFDFDDLDALEAEDQEGCSGLHPSLEDASTAESTDASTPELSCNRGSALPGEGFDEGRATGDQWRKSELFWSRWRLTAALAKELLVVRSEFSLSGAEMGKQGRHPQQQEAPTCETDGHTGSHVWEVVAGRGEGGVVVRRSRRACSLVEKERLAFGARVRELALEGDRLQYQRLSGRGPETGWVSIHSARSGGQQGVQLVRLPPAAPSGPPRPAAPLEAPGGASIAAGDAVERCVLGGTRHLEGAVCGTLDSGLFELLREELSRIQRDKNLPTKNGIWSSIGHRLPAHDFVLRRLMQTFKAEGLSWASNLYEAASVPCGFHHDGSKYGGDSHNPSLRSDITMIASFGATRDLTLRHDDTGREFAFPQRNGDMFAFYKEVDNDFMHGLHPEEAAGEPRISVVIIGRQRRGLDPEKRWAPRFKSNMPLGLDVGGEPRLYQFSGIFVSEEPHLFLPEELRRLATHGTRAAESFFELHGDWLKRRSGMVDVFGPA